MLRPWTLADAPSVVAAYTDPLIRHWHMRTMSRDEAEEWVVAAGKGWMEESAASWAITSLSGELVGRMTLGAVDLNAALADVRYWVVPLARVAEGAGYALEGTRRSQLLHEDGWHDTHLHAFLSQVTLAEGWCPSLVCVLARGRLLDTLPRGGRRTVCPSVAHAEALTSLARLHRLINCFSSWAGAARWGGLRWLQLGRVVEVAFGRTSTKR